MNVTAYSQTSYLQGFRQGSLTGAGRSGAASDMASMAANRAQLRSAQQSMRLRQNIRTLERNSAADDTDTYDSSLSWLNELLQMTGDTGAEANEIRQLIDDSKEEAVQKVSQNRSTFSFSFDKINELFTKAAASKSDNKTASKKPSRYNYKEVASMIRRAKTSVSAGNALRSARRKVIEVKRKISNADGDAKELQLALTHAERMEMAARKKKHHLEIEEMVENTSRSEWESEGKDPAQALRSSLIESQEDKASKIEDEVFEMREEMFDEAVASDLH